MLIFNEIKGILGTKLFVVPKNNVKKVFPCSKSDITAIIFEQFLLFEVTTVVAKLGSNGLENYARRVYKTKNTKFLLLC